MVVLILSLKDELSSRRLRSSSASFRNLVVRFAPQMFGSAAGTVVILDPREHSTSEILKMVCFGDTTL